MSEEIIIDGVDVSGCKFYKETLQAYKDGKIYSWKGYGFCTHNIKGLNNAGCYAEDFARCLKNDCYYKQLKRLEQENKELKELKCKFKEYCTCDTERLQSENERLKEEIKKEKEIYKENVHYLACMTSQRNKLKLALEEIREIAEKRNYLNLDEALDDILDKINEVLKEQQ